MYWIVNFFVFLLVKQCICKPRTQPNIIIICADDLGWNDISFHGSPQIPTPNIDALALSGISFNNFYAEWECSPSRGALMTGMYPIRLGLQHLAFSAGQRSALPLNVTILPQHLQKLGYETHMVGKWHLGYYKKEFMPTYRGFKTFLGYLNGALDYYDYTNDNDGFPKQNPTQHVFFGIDLYNGTQPIRHFRSHYATDLFAATARNIVLDHDKKKPLFLYLPHLAVHASGSVQRVQAPPDQVSKFKYIQDKNRRIYAGTAAVLDNAVGMLFEALYHKSMLQNSIIIFLSDNGGEVDEASGGYGSNYPLRGKKLTLWEGGVRVPAVVWSPLFKLKEPRISDQLFHITDLLPTLYKAGGGDPKNLGKIDGIDVWDIFTNASASPRTNFLVNIDPIYGASSYREGDLKVVNGTTGEGYDSWYGPSGLEQGTPSSMESWVFKDGSVVRDLLKKMGMWTVKNANEWYKQSQIVCQQPPPASSANCDANKRPCLFNITEDPCEYNDLAQDYPEVVKSMMNTINDYQKQAVPPENGPLDPNADPACHDFTFVPWMDPEHYVECDYLS